MNIKSFLSIVSAILIFNSCINKKKSADEDINYPIFNPLEITKEVVDLKNQIESVDFIHIDTMTPLMNFDFVKIAVLDDGDFILLTGTSILKFNKSGKYLLKFGELGRGPGEYMKIYDICLNNDKTELLALNSLNQVLRYNLSTSDYLGTIKLKYKTPNADAIIPDKNEGFYIYYANEGNASKYNEDFSCLKQFNKKGEFISENIPWKDFNISYPGSSFISYNYDNSYIIRPQENENICYQIKDGKITKLCKIHFGEENIEPHFAFKGTKSPWDKLGKIISSDFYKTPFCIQKTEKHLSFSAIGPQSAIGYFLVSLENNNGIHWIDYNKGPMPFFIIGSDKTHFYGIFNDYSDYTEKEIDGLSPLLKYLIQECKLKLREDDNPIIVKLKFK